MPRHSIIVILFFFALMNLVFPFSAAQGSSTVEPAGISITTNEAIYVLGETVHVKGQVEYPLDFDNLVVMMVIAPSGERLIIDEFELNTDGRFAWSFNLPTTEEGQWIVNSRFSTREAEVVITVLETDLFDKVLAENPAVFDIQGNAMIEGRVGKSAAITATLVNDEQVSQSFVFIVQIINEEGTISSLLLTLGTLQSNESTNPSVLWLPKEQGSFTIEIFVWSSLKDPTALVEKQAVAFNIA